MCVALLLLDLLEAPPSLPSVRFFRQRSPWDRTEGLGGMQVTWARTSRRLSLVSRVADSTAIRSRDPLVVVALARFSLQPTSCFIVMESRLDWACANKVKPLVGSLLRRCFHAYLPSSLLILAGLFLSSSNLCAQSVQQPSGTASALTGKQTEDSSGVEHPVPAERNPRYRLNRSDVLALSFSLSPEFNQNVTVQPDGFITLQGVGSINVLGLTLPETVVAIKNAYSKMLRNPIIDVDLTDFQKAYFIVTGQVSKPGQYDLRYDLTVSEAIAVAGGFLPTAKTQVLLYRRCETGWVEAKELKLKNFLHGKDVAEDVEMRPGDMIFVPEKTITKIRKYIPYSIGIPLSTTPAVY